jgi:nitrate reductase NapAB chaperone NapD
LFVADLQLTVQSYLLMPASGCKESVRAAASRVAGCEVISAANRDVLVLVSTTETAEQQRQVESQLEKLDGLDCLALVSGYTEQ